MFLYKYNDFCFYNREVLLRTVSMHALYLFEHEKDYKRYISNYNSDNG
jgi:hypothetical protein